MPLQIRRGTNNQRQNMVTPLAPGELLYTTDTERMYVGNGTTLGGNLISGFTDINAKDAAAEMIVNGTHQRISFTYDENTQTLNAVVDTSVDQGPLVADAFVGSVFADDSTLLVDAVEGRIVGPVFSNVTGNVVGDVTGSVVGDVTGSVFADDSTLLVDAVEGRIVGPVFSNVTGNVVGDVTGSVVGNVVGDLTGSVFADDSSLIISGIDKSLSINSIDSTSSAIEVGTKFIFNSGASESVVLDQISSNALSDSILFKKSRGTPSALQAVSNGDVLASIEFLGFDGFDYLLSSRISVSVDGTVSTNTVPSKIDFFINDRLGNSKNPFVIGSSFDNQPTMVFKSERGSIDAPLKVESGDRVRQMTFSSYDGTKYLEHAFINVEVLGATSVDVIPTSFNIDLLHPEGTYIRPFQIDPFGTIQIFKPYADGPVMRITQGYDVADAANVEFLRSRGSTLAPTQNLVGDDIIDFSFSAYHNGTHRPSVGIEVKVAEFNGNRVVSTIAIGMDNGAGFAERFLFESTGTINHIQPALTVGSNPGEVDDSAPVEYLRVKLNGTEYAMPLFAINPTP